METHRLSEIHQKHMDSISLEEKNYTDEWTYGEEEDELACARFPHLKFCLCLYPCIQALQNNPIYQVYLLLHWNIYIYIYRSTMEFY